MSEIEIMKHYDKSKVALRYWLLGRGYEKSMRAFEFTHSHCDGKLRKDGVTPAFQHQITVTHMARVYEAFLIHKDETFAALLLHDIIEDYGVSYEEIANLFGVRVARSVWLLSKKFRGTTKELETYYEEMYEDPISSVGKGCDRANNLETALDVHPEKKQLFYVEETEELIIPMIKRAQKRFPQQDPIYENLKLVLRSQLHFAKMVHQTKGLQCQEAPNTSVSTDSPESI